MPSTDPEASWGEYRRLILANLERIERDIGAINAKVDQFQVDIAMLRVKSGVWGGASGLLVALGAVLLQFLK